MYPAHATPRYLTVTQAAKRLGVDPRSVRRYCEAGALTAHQTPGGHWRIDAVASGFDPAPAPVAA